MMDGNTNRLRVLGTGHSFSDVADTTGIFISLENFDQIEVDKEHWTVTIGAGVTYSTLLEELKKHKVAIENVPSLPHLNVIGSLVTGTHGGGASKPEIAENILEMEIVDYNGNVKTLKKNNINGEKDRLFDSTVHSFGLLGAITEVKLRISPEYGIRKCIYENLSWDVVNNKELFDEMLASKDFISFFTTWENPEMTSVWTSEIIDH